MGKLREPLRECSLPAALAAMAAANDSVRTMVGLPVKPVAERYLSRKVASSNRKLIGAVAGGRAHALG